MNFKIGRIAITLLILVFPSVIFISDVSSAQRVSVGYSFPNQVTNSTSSSQVSNSTTTTGSNSTRVSNSTARSNVTITSRTNSTANLEFQIKGLSQQLDALSSKVDSVSQDENTNRWITILSLGLAFIAIVAAVAVAQRADSLYRRSAQPVPTPQAPAPKS